MEWLINLFYYEGDLLKSCFSFFAFFVVLLVVLEMMYIIKSASKSFMY